MGNKLMEEYDMLKSKLRKTIVYLLVASFVFSIFANLAVPGVFAAGDVILKQRDWSQYVRRDYYNTLSDEDKEIYDKMDKVCRDVLEGRQDTSYNSLSKSYQLPALYIGDDTSKVMSILTKMLKDNPIYFFTSTQFSKNGTGNIYLFCYPEFADKDVRIAATNELFDKVDSWSEIVNNAGDTRYKKAKKANDLIIENVVYDQSSEGNRVSLHQSIYSSFINGRSVCNGYAFSMTILMNKVGVPCMSVSSITHAWNKICMDDGKWYATDVTWNDDGSTSNNKYMNQSDEAIKFHDTSSEHNLLDGCPAPKCESTYYPPGETLVWDGGVAHVIVGGDDTDVTDDGTDKGNNNSDANQQNKDNSSNQQGKTDTNNQQNNNQATNDQAANQNNDVAQQAGNGAAPQESTPSYKSEWVNGRWYDADGNQTYEGTLSWKSNSTGWWVEDSAGWYPVSCWQKIDGDWYYFDDTGYMASSEWRDGCWLGSSGAWNYEGVGSWHKDSKGWWFGDTSGWYAYSEWQKINGEWYYFNASGYLK